MNYREQIRSVKDYINMPLLYNHWYVAGFGEEFGRKPKAKTLLERSIVFYRTEAGELTAFSAAFQMLEEEWPAADRRIVSRARLVGLALVERPEHETPLAGGVRGRLTAPVRQAPQPACLRKDRT